MSNLSDLKHFKALALQEAAHEKQPIAAVVLPYLDDLLEVAGGAGHDLEIQRMSPAAVLMLIREVLGSI